MGDEPKLSVSAEVKADLTEITGQFLEKVDKGAGGWFSSTIKLRNAKAQAKAAILEAETEAKIAEIKQKAWLANAEFEENALALYRGRAIRDFENIASISEKATALLTEGAKPEEVDDDWMANLIDKAKIVSNEDMQTVWSHVLAGEANNPGSFSRRTVNCLADLDWRDCEDFTNLCSFAWLFEPHDDYGGELVPLILSFRDPIYVDNNVTWGMLSHLESIGLIVMSAFERLELTRRLGRPQPISYFGSKYLLDDVTSLDGTTNVGKAQFTRVGRELAPIAGGTPVPGFERYITERWVKLLRDVE